jgi:hypothetical protein
MKGKFFSRIVSGTKIVLFLIFVLSANTDLFAGKSYCFRVYLKDKDAAAYSVVYPEKFLSPECIERRMLHEVFIDESDFPVSQNYIDGISAMGFTPVVQSKWMNTVVVESADSLQVNKLIDAGFVDSVKCVWNGGERMNYDPCDENAYEFNSSDSILDSKYGYACQQTALLKGDQLHFLGKTGKGARIAVIDAGFMNVDKISAFSSLRLLGEHNFSLPGRSVFCEDDHGTKVLSCLASNLEGVMVGSAPDASYLLLKSEDTRGENPIEEDFWVAAVEYADSAGVDIISSSLGYYKFDSIENYYATADLDGKTSFISRAAGVAADKGLLVVTSAGNEGNKDWAKITFPADVENILTVGSITSNREKSDFSSTGLTADYRIKPDVVAIGTGVYVIDSAGQAMRVSGTSFAAPTVAGFAACLWQAFPLLKNTDVIQLIKESSSQSNKPDSQMGYGIPDIFKAYNKAKNR